MAGAMTAALIPAAVSAQSAAAPKAKAAAQPKAAATNEIPGKETPKLYNGFVQKKNFFGQPDLSGAWTNGSLTPLSRPATYQGRLVLTPQEVATLEGDEAQSRVAADAPTPVGFTVADLPFSCGRGFSGVGCGYNGGFTDPGSTVTRVHGEPRSSYITYPATGTVPAAKSTAPVASFQAAGEGDGEGTPGAAARGGRGGGAPAAGRGGGAPGGAPAAGRGGAGAPGGGRGGPPVANNNDPESRGLAERCLTSFGQSAGPIMQPQLYNNNYRISQGKDSVAIWVEMVHDVRVVRLTDKHRTDGVRPWWGDSIGHYEGNTLVVETSNYHPQNRISGRSATDLLMTERFTRVANDRLLYQFNVHSPANWEQDWGGEYEFAASPGIYEYACHEGNYALEGILAGNLAALTGNANAGIRPAGQ